MADTAAHVCERCGDQLEVHPSELRRCGCGRSQLEWGTAGCLGPTVTRWPTRPYRNRIRP